MTDAKPQQDTELLCSIADELESLGMSSAAESVRGAAAELDELRRMVATIGELPDSWRDEATENAEYPGAETLLEWCGRQLEQALRAAPAETPLSAGERHVMEHSVGWPKRYRNHFCASPGHDDWDTLQALCERGLMRVARQPSELSGGDYVFQVTDAGIAALGAAPAETDQGEETGR